MRFRITAMTLAAPLLALALLSHQPLSTALGRTFSGLHGGHAAATPLATSAPDPAGGNATEADVDSQPAASANFNGPGPGWG